MAAGATANGSSRLTSTRLAGPFVSSDIAATISALSRHPFDEPRLGEHSAASSLVGGTSYPDPSRQERSVMDECPHGTEAAWCAICSKTDDSVGSRTGSYGFHGGEVKQDVLNDVTHLLGMPSRVVSVGSSLPSDVFQAAASRVQVSANGSMPEILERIVAKAGHHYSPGFDSRGTISGGGSTVTLEGIQALRSALRTLL